MRTFAASLILFASLGAHAGVGVISGPARGDGDAPAGWTVVTLDSGAAVVEIRTDGRQLGLGPHAENWYGGGALHITCGGRKTSAIPGTLQIEPTRPELARVRMRWLFPEGLVTVTFELREGDDKLLLTVNSPDPATTRVRLQCYPSSFAGGSRQGRALRQRRAITAGRDVALEDRHAVRTPLGAEEPWVLFLDDHFDVAADRGRGPCAALYFPHEVANAVATTGNYSCYLDLAPAAGTADLHVVLWDFSGLTNRDALAYMRRVELVPAPEPEQP